MAGTVAVMDQVEEERIAVFLRAEDGFHRLLDGEVAVVLRDAELHVRLFGLGDEVAGQLPVECHALLDQDAQPRLEGDTREGRVRRRGRAGDDEIGVDRPGSLGEVVETDALAQARQLPRGGEELFVHVDQGHGLVGGVGCDDIQRPTASAAGPDVDHSQNAVGHTVSPRHLAVSIANFGAGGSRSR